MFIYLYTVAPGLQTAREMRDMKGIAGTYDERKEKMNTQSNQVFQPDKIQTSHRP